MIGSESHEVADTGATGSDNQDVVLLQRRVNELLEENHAKDIENLNLKE